MPPNIARGRTLDLETLYIPSDHRKAHSAGIRKRRGRAEVGEGALTVLFSVLQALRA